jgi:hypothetical protein
VAGRAGNPQPPNSNHDVTETSGYEFEEKIPFRTSNGFGGTQTKLPKGHLARRDTPPVAKQMSSGKRR